MASPDSLHLSDVLQQLKYYMNKERRENGFDVSGPYNLNGQYSPFTGGSYYFCYHQDKQLKMILDSYAKHQNGEESGLIDDMLASRPILGRVKGYLEPTTASEIEFHLQNECSRLLISVGQLVLNESGIPVYQLLKDKGSKKEDKTSLVSSKTSISVKSSSSHSSKSSHCNKIPFMASAPDGLRSFKSSTFPRIGCLRNTPLTRGVHRSQDESDKGAVSMVSSTLDNAKRKELLKEKEKDTF